MDGKTPPYKAKPVKPKMTPTIFYLATGNHEMYVNRRKGDSLEVQQMKVCVQSRYLLTAFRQARNQRIESSTFEVLWLDLMLRFLVKHFKHYYDLKKNVTISPSMSLRVAPIIIINNDGSGCLPMKLLHDDQQGSQLLGCGRNLTWYYYYG